MFIQYILISLAALCSCIVPAQILSSENSTSITLYIVRHGQTDWNVERRMQGHSDRPLNDAGRAEVSQLASELKGIRFAAYYSSDLQRAFETAQILTKNIAPPVVINTDKRLRERNFGHWEGHLFNEYYLAPPEEKLDVESDEQMQQRAFQFLQQIVICQQNGDNVLIVSHGGILKNLLFKILPLACGHEDIEVKNAAVLVLEYQNNEWSVKDLKNIKVYQSHIPLQEYRL